ncbi:MAG TPA: endospore germination permease [Oscillospiraceae bacterium]|nr:endospore germination permease [Oscillospiraceae bacterium]
MENSNDIISTDQMIFILALTIISTGILTLPRNLAEAVPYDHWVVLLAGGLAATAVIATQAWIIKLRPGKQYFDILCDALSKPIAYIVSLAYIVYFIGLIGLFTRLFGEVIKVYLLNRTPIEVVNMSILASCIYLSRKGIEVLGRLMTFLFPVVLIVTMFLFFLSFIKADFKNILPIFQISFTEILQSIPVTILSFLGLEVILIFGANLESPKDSMKVTISVVAVTLFYLLIVVVNFAQFGPIQIKRIIWPTLDLFDNIELPGLFVENVQVIVMSAWVITVFTTIAPLYLAGVTMAKSVVNFRDQACLSAPFLPFIYFTSLIPKNLAHLYEITNKFSKYFASIMVVGVPLIVLISLLIQTRLNREVKIGA